MKDSSSVKIDHCNYYGNDYAIANYQKHPGDAGANAVVTNSVLSNSYESGYLNDEYSAISISNSLDDTEKLPEGKNNLHANPLFTNPTFYDFTLMTGSPLKGAGTEGTTIGTLLELPELTPSLMITDIAYYTLQGTDDLEFVGLYNPGNSRIYLDSCAFNKGITFQFPSWASIGPKEKIYITSNESLSFWNDRGTILYQWTSGRLADEGETIQLVNKYGKVIDQVKYNNKTPWPLPTTSLQGISLKGYNVDNHFGENWQLLTTNEIVSTKNLIKNEGLRVYPIPTKGLITLESNGLSTSTIEVYNLNGMKVHEDKVTDIQQTLNLSNLQQGMYIVKVGVNTQKVIIMR